MNQEIISKVERCFAKNVFLNQITPFFRPIEISKRIGVNYHDTQRAIHELTRRKVLDRNKLPGVQGSYKMNRDYFLRYYSLK